MDENAAKSWICMVCGYLHEGPEPPEACPVCGAASENFELEEQKEDSGAQSQTWLCSVCGYVHEGVAPPAECPQCGAPSEDFEVHEKDSGPDTTAGMDAGPSEDYLKAWSRDTDTFEGKFAQIRDLAVTGRSKSSAMRTQKPYPDWDLVLFRGAQLAQMPLNEEDTVRTATVIGKTAAQPLTLQIPFYVSHMSFGALSKAAKIALARGARAVGTATCSGEGGLLPAERAEASRYIYELGTAAFSHKDESIQQADAVEIKIGQAAKPGMGGHLPKEKVTEEIARVRGIAQGEDSISPGRHTGIDSAEDLAKYVARLRDLTEGKPIGVKITAGHIEADLEIVVAAKPDFITIDCRGGGTGSALDYVKDNVCIPAVFATYRARRFLDKAGSSATLCMTGGFRDGTDIAKALALGADAIALATTSLIAIGCQQYRVCHTGRCPVGIATQNADLRSRFDIDESVKRFINVYSATREELKNLARINGRANIHDLDVSDLITISREISEHTNIEHV